MSTLKVNTIQPNTRDYISIEGDINITGSLVHNGHTTLSGINILSGSTVFKGTTTVEGDLTVGGRLTAQEVRTEFENAGVVFESGSTKFGDTPGDNHAFTGSLGVQGGAFKVTNSGDDVLVADPITGTFTIGDTQGLGDSALITGDSSLIRLKNNSTTTLAADNNNRVGIGTESPSGSFHVTVNSSDSNKEFVRFTNDDATLFTINDEGAFTIGDVNFIGDGAYLQNQGDEFSFNFGATKGLSIEATLSTFNERVYIKNTSGGDATLTLESDIVNTPISGENDNPAILFKQDGGSRNAAIGFNIIDDTDGGTGPGSGNRFWIVNAISDTIGEGGITFGTAQVDGWENAIGRFMIRGDGKGLFGHPNDHYGKVLGSQFEIYDDRTENTTSDYTLSIYGYVDVAEYPPSQGSGGIISRVKVVNGATDLGTHAIGIAPGTTTSDILTTGDFAFYVGSDMDTSAATGFAGLIHSGSGNWQIGGTGGSDTDTGYKLTVVGTSKFNSDVLIGGNLTHSGNTMFNTSGKGIEWYMNTDGASIKFYNTGDADTDSRLEFNTRDNNNEYFRWTHTTAGGLYESMRLSPINSGSNSRLTVSGDLYADGAANVKDSLTINYIDGTYPRVFPQQGDNFTTLPTGRIGVVNSDGALEWAFAAVTAGDSESKRSGILHSKSNAYRLILTNAVEENVYLNSEGDSFMKGRVAIGKDIPTQQLDVEGSVAVSGDIYANRIRRTGGANELRINQARFFDTGNIANKYGTDIGATLHLRTDAPLANQSVIAITREGDGTDFPSGITQSATGNYTFLLRDSSNTQRIKFTSNTSDNSFIDTGKITLCGNSTSANGGISIDGQKWSSGVRNAIMTFNKTGTQTDNALEFRVGGILRGSINYSDTGTAYNVASDYRLKENVVEITDGIERLKQLKPSKFNFISNPDKVVDGFIAHEVQDVIPEAITGLKDATEEYEVTPAEYDDYGNLVSEAVMGTREAYQQIDQAKIVPLLTAALQEAVAKIEALEARIQTLEGN